jgi:hypothetical protein
MKITKIGQFLTRDVRRQLGSGSVNFDCALASQSEPEPRALLIIKQFKAGGPRSTTLKGQRPAELRRFVAGGCPTEAYDEEHTMKRRQKPVLLLVMAAMMIMAMTAVRAQTAASPSETDFQVMTTGDLVRLCEASPTDATGIAALHFCHGFAVGAYQYHQIAAAAEAKPPLFCEPRPRPMRNEAIAGFISWAKQNPRAMNTLPVEGIFRYLAQHYPCSR